VNLSCETVITPTNFARREAIGTSGTSPQVLGPNLSSERPAPIRNYQTERRSFKAMLACNDGLAAYLATHGVKADLGFIG
jgi:hypothetical protein